MTMNLVDQSANQVPSPNQFPPSFNPIVGPNGPATVSTSNLVTSEVNESVSSSSSVTESVVSSSFDGGQSKVVSSISDSSLSHPSVSPNTNSSAHPTVIGSSTFPSITYLTSSRWLTSPYAAWIVSVIGFVFIGLLLTLIYQRVRKRNRKLRELRHLTPEASLSTFGGSNSRSALALGIKPSHSIEFVVPTITVPGTLSCSSFDDSFTDSDCLPFTSGSDREYLSSTSGRSARKRHNTGQNYSLSPYDIQPPLYGSKGILGIGDYGLLSGPLSGSGSDKWIGRVVFVLHYNSSRQRLLVTLLSASDLPNSEKRSTLNPAAKVTLLPFNDQKFVTKVHKNTRNPVFNELFVFPARKDNLDEMQLKITIVDNDRFSRKYFVGQCIYNLTQSGIQSGITSDVITDEIVCTLSTEKTAASPGELQVSLCYRSSEATLTLVIMKARGLTVKDVTSVYPKVSLFLGKKRIGSKKSPIRKAYSSIEFNDSFHVHIKDTAIDNVNIVISLIGRTSIGLNTRHNFGKICLGGCTTPGGSSHWIEMIKSNPNPIVKWHPLNRNI